MAKATRITQKDLAEKAGVTQATVSLALSNHFSISPETRARIQGIAEKMGYQPDPYLSGLSAYRKRVRSPRFQATLAWLSNYPASTPWKQQSTLLNYFEGAKERARELGYQLEEHELTAPGMTSARLERIFAARNIPGILLMPQPKAGMQLDFCFDRFSAVSFGYTLEKPQLHLVALQQFRSVETAFRKLISLGYRRPGLAMALESDKRADRNWSAAFWMSQRQLPQRDRIPLLLQQPLHRTTFMKWYQRYRPDVIISMGTYVYEWLRAEGVAVPEETGFSLLSVPDEGAFYSGIWENPRVIGAKAVDFLVDLVHRNECGCPTVPLSMLVSGTWVDGKTIRAQT
ncbi:MAG: LacI family DNA-binding transcriptional regulator [Chthoniobacteraceae bacterium]|nr:LacI family DNA-binding transcriptional regulator [Chthoniobacteraceae bacterium]